MPRKRSPADSNGNADGVIQEAVLSRSDRNDPGLNLVKRLFHKPNRQTLEHLRERVRQILPSANYASDPKEFGGIVVPSEAGW